jgi:hypothetical protein
VKSVFSVRSLSYKITAEATNAPTGKISRAQRYKKAVNKEQEDVKI